MELTVQRVSPLTGLALARQHWRLVLAVWIVPTLLAVPAWLIVRGAAGRSLGSIPPQVSADAVLALVDGLREVGPALAAAVGFALVASWLWTILWHAGATGWLAWGASRPVRLGAVVGLGVLRFWRYLRLAMAALAGTGVLLGVVCGPLAALAVAARRQLAEVRMLNLEIAALALGGFILWLGWTITLRAAWVLADPTRRSAVVAWLRGLAGVARDPLRSLATVLLWVGLGKVFTLAPLVAGLLVDDLGGTFLGTLLGEACALLAAACWVALFLSFAPVSGLLPDGDGAEPVTKEAEPIADRDEPVPDEQSLRAAAVDAPSPASPPSPHE